MFIMMDYTFQASFKFQSLFSCCLLTADWMEGRKKVVNSKSNYYWSPDRCYGPGKIVTGISLLDEETQ